MPTGSKKSERFHVILETDLRSLMIYVCLLKIDSSAATSASAMNMVLQKIPGLEERGQDAYVLSLTPIENHLLQHLHSDIVVLKVITIKTTQRTLVTIWNIAGSCYRNAMAASCALATPAPSRCWTRRLARSKPPLLSPCSSQMHLRACRLPAVVDKHNTSDTLWPTDEGVVDGWAVC